MTTAHLISREACALHDADTILREQQEKCRMQFHGVDMVAYGILESARRSLRVKLHNYLTRGEHV